MNSRQPSRASPGRGPVLLANLPSLFHRSSSPPLITNSSTVIKTTPNFTSQFVRLNDQSPIRHLAPQRQKTTSTVDGVRWENQTFKNPATYNVSYKKARSVLDLRIISKQEEDKNNIISKKDGKPIKGSETLGGIIGVRSSSNSISMDNHKESSFHGSILKNSKGKPQPDLFGRGHEDYDKELSLSTKSKRKVLFKNKVSVFRFDSDDDSGCSLSEHEKHSKLGVNSQRHQRRYRSMALAAGPNSSKKASSKLFSLSTLLNQKRDKTVILPPTPKPNVSSVQDENFYLFFGDEGDEEIKKAEDTSAGLSSNSSATFDTNSYFGALQLPQQSANESVLYSTPSGAFIINSSLNEDLNNKSVLFPSKGASAHNERNGHTDRSDQKTRQIAEYQGSMSLQLRRLKQSKKDATFRYHLNDSDNLAVSMQLGLTLHPSDVLVKANKNGTKLRIVNNPDSKPFMELNEQVMLPVHVDPYKLSAKIDQSGNLLIEAPVLKR